MKANPQATAVLAATYVDAAPSATSWGASLDGIALDSDNNVFVDGISGSVQFPLKNPFVTQWETAAFSVDIVLAELSPDLSSLLFGSFLNPTN